MAERIPLDLARFRRNLAEIETELARHTRADGAPPQVVVVSKYLSAQDAHRLRREGFGPLGENRAQELLQKTQESQSAGDPQGWHFIGHLQRNKISQVLPRVGLLHSVDSLRLAEAVDRWAEKAGTTCRCLLQVNVSGESSKGGIPLSEALQEIPGAVVRFQNVEWAGLMTMAPLGTAEESRPTFRRLRQLRDELRETLPGPLSHRLRELSMGMSNDYPVAVEEGATLVRIGRRLF